MKMVHVRKEDWYKNDIMTLEKLHIIKYTGNQWNEKWEYPDLVPEYMAKKLRKGHYQPDCTEMIALRNDITRMMANRHSNKYNNNDANLFSSLSDYLSYHKDKQIRDFIASPEVKPMPVRRNIGDVIPIKSRSKDKFIHRIPNHDTVQPIKRRTETVMGPVEFHERMFAKELKENSSDEWKFLETVCNIIKSYDMKEVSKNFLSDTLTVTIQAYKSGNFTSQEKCNDIAEKKFFHYQEIIEECDSIDIEGDALNAFLTLCDYGIFDLAMKNYIFLGVAIRDNIEPILKRFEIKLKKKL